MRLVMMTLEAAENNWLRLKRSVTMKIFFCNLLQPYFWSPCT